MAVNFPKKSDIPLENAPINEVICQIRMPPILRISKEIPTDFQEEIRHEFPNLETEQGFLFRIPKAGVEERPGVEPDKIINRFKAKDGNTTISLAVDFFALSTKKYSHWDDFLRFLQLMLEATQKIYNPPYATRIGLRFINKLTSLNTGLDSLPEICELIHPDLTIINRSDKWPPSEEMETRILLLDDNGKLNMRTGYGINEDENPYYILDFDYFEEGQIALNDLVKRLTHYHNVIYRAFRWCIPDEKLHIFKPNKVKK